MFFGRASTSTPGETLRRSSSTSSSPEPLSTTTISSGSSPSATRSPTQRRVSSERFQLRTTAAVTALCDVCQDLLDLFHVSIPAELVLTREQSLAGAGQAIWLVHEPL